VFSRLSYPFSFCPDMCLQDMQVETDSLEESQIPIRRYCKPDMLLDTYTRRHFSNEKRESSLSKEIVQGDRTSRAS
jgi:hypothetical protein